MSEISKVFLNKKLSSLIAQHAADIILQNGQNNARGTTMTTTTTTTKSAILPTFVLEHLKAKGLTKNDIAEVRKRVNKTGRLPAKYNDVIKEVRQMLKNHASAQNTETTSEVAPTQLAESVSKAISNLAPVPTPTPAPASSPQEEVWGDPVASYQLGANTQLRVNRSSLGRMGFRVFFKRQNDAEYSPSKKGFTLSPDQVKHLKAAL